MGDRSDKDNPIRRSDSQGPSSSQTYSRVCIFCQKESKYIRRNKTRDYLVQCRELGADATVRNAATRKNDSRILTLVSRDLVAAEGHYYRSCSRNYTRYLNTAKSVSTEEGTDHCAVALEKSYTEHFHFIRTDLFVTPRDMTMVELFSRLAASMHACEDSVKKHIHRTLEREFYSSLHIYRDNEGKLFVFQIT